MKIDVPKLHTKMEKLMPVLQFVLFLAIFIGLAVFIWQLTDSWWLRILLLVADYVVSSLLLYCVFRPLAERCVRTDEKEEK